MNVFSSKSFRFTGIIYSHINNGKFEGLFVVYKNSAI